MIARKVSPERLLESEASLRMAHGFVEDLRRSDGQTPTEPLPPSAIEARRELTAVLETLQQCRAGLPGTSSEDAQPTTLNIAGLLEGIEYRVRVIAALLDSEAHHA